MLQPYLVRRVLLSLFIIRRALRIYCCMRIYAYNLTVLLFHGSAGNGVMTQLPYYTVLIGSSQRITLVVYFAVLPENFGKTVNTYQGYFVNM